MNPFSRNFRQFFYGNSINKGFTLIELLVVIMIIGILSTIALPSTLTQVEKATESGAKLNLNKLTKDQMSHYLEDPRFIQCGESGMTCPAENENYLYTIFVDNNSLNGAAHVALSKKSGLKSYMTVIYFQKGELKICPNVENDLKAPISLFQVIQFALKVKSNPAQYCR
ncbi:MAG: hypothetical protein RLZZ338_4651 [Cyanobacteriota bacterium]|jgi:prepilin-type N-terminal cleavage/methylation domain-containing protein